MLDGPMRAVHIGFNGNNRGMMMDNLKYDGRFWYAYCEDADRWYDAQPRDFDGGKFWHPEYGIIDIVVTDSMVSFFSADDEENELAFFDGADYREGVNELLRLAPADAAPVELAA